jgi:predicted component of viral defense system (DUF524 family)
LPRIVSERRSHTTIDTPENRFVKTFVDVVLGVLERMKHLSSKDDRFVRVRADCTALEQLLAPIRRHPMWRDVGPMTHLPASSTVLHRRRGYREVFRHFILLRLATRHLPLTKHDERDLLESKDIATLYELWCYFRVVELLVRLLGPAAGVDAITRTDFQVHVERAFEVRWQCGIRVLYNATFSRSQPHVGRQTYSLPLRPDIALVLPDGAVHVLDAKFKLEWIDASDDDVDRATVKLEDIYKMHTYRDAIRQARSAWVLYPGTERRAFTPHGGEDADGVGAVPLRPEPGGDELLQEFLRDLMTPFVAVSTQPHAPNR